MALPEVVNSDFTRPRNAHSVQELQPSASVPFCSVLHFKQMSNTITVRLPSDLGEWLAATARKAGVPKGRIIREELERARGSEQRPFLRLAGAIAGPADLSARKGFSRK